jgi:protein required for attachment to host cells
MKPTITWIVIADGARARVLGNAGIGKGLNALSDMVFAGDHASSSEIMADRPGRSFESVGKARHAMEASTDPHEALKVQFVRHLADALQQRCNEFDRLILVAPPETLGMLRKSLPATVSAKVVDEMHKDLTHLPNSELPSHLAEVLAL